MSNSPNCAAIMPSGVRMLERRDGHLFGVEVALDQDVRAGRRRVHGRHRSRRDVPHEIESLVRRLQERPAFAVDVRDARIVRDASGVVGEVIAQERHGDRIQLHAR
jgi:hypothetical protein